MSDVRRQVTELIQQHGLERRDEPFRLVSGEWTHDYIDGKQALADGAGLMLACKAVLELAEQRGVEFDAVGGLTMGSDPLAHGIAMLASKQWFAVRKQTKEHGTKKAIEGAQVGPETRVLLVDDVVTTGGSILQALAAVEEAGARVALAVTIVDRGDRAASEFESRGIPYQPVATYADLGIAPVGAKAAGAQAPS